MCFKPVASPPSFIDMANSQPVNILGQTPRQQPPAEVGYHPSAPQQSSNYSSFLPPLVPLSNKASQPNPKNFVDMLSSMDLEVAGKSIELAQHKYEYMRYRAIMVDMINNRAFITNPVTEEVIVILEKTADQVIFISLIYKDVDLLLSDRKFYRPLLKYTIEAFSDYVIGVYNSIVDHFLTPVSVLGESVLGYNLFQDQSEEEFEDDTITE